jgi:hypothetical protein
MVRPFHFNIASMGFFWRIKSAFRILFALYGKLCAPFLIVLCHTKKLAFIVLMGFAHILVILRFCYIPKINKSVVCWIAVNVVNYSIWKFTSHIKPSKPMAIMFNIVNINSIMTAFHWVSSNLSGNFVFIPACFQVGKNASILIVMKEFFESFLCEHFGNLLSIGLQDAGGRGDKSRFRGNQPYPAF